MCCGNFAPKQLFWLRILGTHIADNREFPTKFAVKRGYQGTRRRRPVRRDCALRHDLGYSTDYAFCYGEGRIPSVFPGLCPSQFRMRLCGDRERPDLRDTDAIVSRE